MGDGQLHVRNNKTGREANVQLLNPDGSFNGGGVTALDRVFGIPKGNGYTVSLRLLFLLDYFSDMVGKDKLIRLESGYRDPEYNRRLRNAGGTVAPTSTHIDAMAIDFSIDGQAGKELWEMIRKEECCGVGHYGGVTIHLDSGRPRFWEAATAKVDSGESDFNRRIYLSTEYDRYLAGEKARLTLSSVSNYPFGVSPSVVIVREGPTGGNGPIEARMEADGDCIAIGHRGDVKRLVASLPPDLPSGLYRIRLHFCRTQFPQMPTEILSNPIEVFSSGSGS